MKSRSLQSTAFAAASGKRNRRSACGSRRTRVARARICVAYRSWADALWIDGPRVRRPAVDGVAGERLVAADRRRVAGSSRARRQRWRCRVGGGGLEAALSLARRSGAAPSCARTSPIFGAFLKWCHRYREELDRNGWIDHATIDALSSGRGYRCAAEISCSRICRRLTPAQAALLRRLETEGCRIEHWDAPSVALESLADRARRHHGGAASGDGLGTQPPRECAGSVRRARRRRPRAAAVGRRSLHREPGPLAAGMAPRRKPCRGSAPRRRVECRRAFDARGHVHDVESLATQPVLRCRRGSRARAARAPPARRRVRAAAFSRSVFAGRLGRTPAP